MFEGAALGPSDVLFDVGAGRGKVALLALALTGCKKVVDDRLPLEPVRTEAEGARVHVAVGYDANALRVVGNVKGEPPYDGTLVHKGWRVRAVSLPALSEEHDAKVIAPAEIELS